MAMIAFGDVFLLIFAGLFPIINPPGTALIFLAMTRHGTHAERAALARRVAIYSFGLITAALYVGAFLLHVFGISIGVLRVAGGIVVALAGWKLLNAEREENDLRGGRSSGLDRMAFYPLTMPLTAGPGTIAVTIALGTSRPTGPGAFVHFATGATAATLMIALTIYVCYRLSDRIETVLGETATDALARFFAFILLCIGIQILWLGFAELWATLPAPQVR